MILISLYTQLSERSKTQYFRTAPQQPIRGNYFNIINEYYTIILPIYLQIYTLTDEVFVKVLMEIYIDIYINIHVDKYIDI